MINLFITDIDGCLAEPFVSPDWNLLTKIRELNQASETDPSIPRLTICSGRPYPYVEAIGQLMGITLPVSFESAGLFNISNHQITTNGVFDEEAEKTITELKNWLNHEIIAKHPAMVAEFTKRMDAGLVHPNTEIINKVYPQIKRYVSENYENVEVHHTDVSVNMVIKKNNKRAGIKSLCECAKVNPSDTAYIGDSSGDIPGLKLVGYPFAPKNASDEVKKVAEVIPYSSTRAVLEVYQRLVEINKAR